MDEQLGFLKLIVSRLETVNIPYMLTGSMAMAVYTLPRMTRDLDLVIECGLGDAVKITQLFASDCYIDEDNVRTAIKDRAMFNIIHNEWIIKADFIVRKGDEYHRTEFRRRRPYDIEGTVVYVTAPEDLILSKLVWAKNSYSRLHVQDVQTIIESASDLDWSYLEKWAIQLEIGDMLNEVRPK